MPTLHGDDLSKLLLLALRLRADPGDDFDVEVNEGDAAELRQKLHNVARQGQDAWRKDEDVRWLHQMSGAQV